MFRNARFLIQNRIGWMLWVLLGIVSPMTAVAQNATSAYPPPEALRLLQIALQRNPSLISAHFEAGAAHSIDENLSTWDAPEIGVDFYQTPIASFPNPVKGEREIDYSVSQTIPFPGKLDAIARPHHLHGAAEESHADAIALDLRRQILSAYADLYKAQWRARLIQEDRQEVERLRGAAKVGYEGGMGSQADLLHAESEEASLDGEALQAEEEQVEAQASLSSLVGVVGAEDTVPQVDSLFPIPLPTGMSLDSLKNLAMGRRPDLESLHREIDMAQAEVKAKGEEAYPDFMLSGAYKDIQNNAGESQGFWSVGVDMKVPIAPWSDKGVRAGVDGAQLMQLKSENDYAAQALMANAEVERAAAALTSAQGRMELARDRQIPLARQALQSALASYQGGKTDFNSVLMAFRDTRMAREEYHVAVSDHLKAWAALEWATGGTLSSTSAPTTPKGD